MKDKKLLIELEMVDILLHQLKEPDNQLYRNNKTIYFINRKRLYKTITEIANKKGKSSDKIILAQQWEKHIYKQTELLMNSNTLKYLQEVSFLLGVADENS